ncbi:hypothetical protein TNCV_2184461 [Trichonephila clavipes]|nr:hypothetical protein TNCV_2184461 [Trichonephila clavipes]
MHGRKCVGYRSKESESVVTRSHNEFHVGHRSCDVNYQTSGYALHLSVGTLQEIQFVCWSCTFFYQSMHQGDICDFGVCKTFLANLRKMILEMSAGTEIWLLKCSCEECHFEQNEDFSAMGCYSNLNLCNVSPTSS